MIFRPRARTRVRVRAWSWPWFGPLFFYTSSCLDVVTHGLSMPFSTVYKRGFSKWGFSDLGQVQGQDQDQGHGQDQKWRQRSALQQQMVLALTLTLVLALVGNIIILRRRRRTPPGLSHWLEHTVCENTLIWYSIFYGDRSIVTCDYITECVVWPSRLLESFKGFMGGFTRVWRAS